MEMRYKKKLSDGNSNVSDFMKNNSTKLASLKMISQSSNIQVAMKIFSTDFKVPMFYTFLLFGCIVKYKFKLLNYCHKYSLKKGKTSKTPNNFTNMGFLKTNELKCLVRSLTRKKIIKQSSHVLSKFLPLTSTLFCFFQK